MHSKKYLLRNINLLLRITFDIWPTSPSHILLLHHRGFLSHIGNVFAMHILWLHGKSHHIIVTYPSAVSSENVLSIIKNVFALSLAAILGSYSASVAQFSSSSGQTHYASVQVFRLKAWTVMSKNEWRDVIYRFHEFQEGRIMLQGGFSPTHILRASLKTLLFLPQPWSFSNWRRLRWSF